MKKLLISLPTLLLIMATLAVRLASGAESTTQPRLTSSERSALAKVLAKSAKGSITVACAGIWCAGLALDVTEAFRRGGWKVSPHDRGGIGVDGVSGIRINACGFAGRSVEKAIRRATKRVPRVVDDGPCRAGDRQIYLVIGPREP